LILSLPAATSFGFADDDDGFDMLLKAFKVKSLARSFENMQNSQRPRRRLPSCRCLRGARAATHRKGIAVDAQLLAPAPPAACCVRATAVLLPSSPESTRFEFRSFEFLIKENCSKKSGMSLFQ